MTNALGGVTVYGYDLRGNRTYEGGATYPVRREYDVFGNVTSMATYRDGASGAGDVTRWAYDAATGAMTNKTYADGRGPSYEYDANGRLARRTWARGVETAYSYDGWGNLTNTAYSDGTPAVALSYDAMGRQVAAVDAAGTTAFAYDTFGANTNETVTGVAGTNTIERLYDEFGRDAGYALNGVRRSAIGYDPATGRLATMLAAGSGTPFVWSYLDGSDLKSSLTYPNGLAASWDYDGCGLLTRVRNAAATDVVSQYDYAYDAAGRRVSCAKSGSAFATPDTYGYRYNARSELTNATAAVDAAYRYGYGFDDIGNREQSAERGTNCSYAANGLNQYAAVGGFAPEYDADGNQTLVKTSTGTWRVAYNGENRPIRWESGDTVVTMTFDRMGRRVAKGNRCFVYDGYLQVADSAGSAYVWDPTESAATRPLVWLRGGDAAYYTHDGNKNVSEVVSAGGTLAAHDGYAPFGAVVVKVFTIAREWLINEKA